MDLPDPVCRYLKHVLAQNQRPIRVVRMAQRGGLRTDPRRPRWMRFSASHVVRPGSRSFAWDARVWIFPLLHLRVRDAYANGVGAGRVQLLSAIPLASESNAPELNAGSLHRYLAEAVWYPTALLPSAGVQWDAIDEHRALATMTDCGNTVSLEFRFNDRDEVAGIHTPGRWSRTPAGYERIPWEGRFSGYHRHQGVLVPMRGEVGWHVDGRLEIVWKGEATALEYEFEAAG